MNRDDIIRMAKVAERYAGEFCNGIGDTEQHHWFDAYNERFAALVAAAEREACAVIVSPCCKDCAKEIRARGEK